MNFEEIANLSDEELAAAYEEKLEMRAVQSREVQHIAAEMAKRFTKRVSGVEL